jgi:hypothetical protein
VRLRRTLNTILFLGLALTSKNLFAQSVYPEELALPENPVQGKPGELKTDVPPESLSFGNQTESEEPSKAPAPTEIPPPQSTKTKTATAIKKNAPVPLGEILPPGTAQSDSESPIGDEADKADAAAETVNKMDPTQQRQGTETDPQQATENLRGGQDADQGSVMINPGAGGEDDDDGGTAGTPHPRNKICNCSYSTSIPYSERRTPLGGLLTIMAGSFSPVNYQPDFNASSFASYYNQASPNIELGYGLKYNFSLGSLAAQFSGGYYKATATSDGAMLTVFPVTLGLNYSMDNLFKEPYFVPYLVFGMYSDIYNESDGGQTVKGNSPFSEFYALGLMFQLDALDPETHNAGYTDFGLENTFVFIEARSFLPASNTVTDFSTPLQFSGGLKVEF